MNIEYAVSKRHKVAYVSAQPNPHTIVFMGFRPKDWKRFQTGTMPIKQNIQAWYLHLSVFSASYTYKTRRQQ